MMTAIDVKNYKVLDSLHVDGLEQINIFVGKNNCGKTSLLEAIFLNLNPWCQSTFFVANVIRGMQLNNNNLDTFFHALNKNAPIELKSFYNSKEITTTISPRYTHVWQKQPNIRVDTASFVEVLPFRQDQTHIMSQITNDLILGLDIKVLRDNQPPEGYFFELDGSNITRVTNTPIVSYPAVFVPSNIIQMNLQQPINKIRIDKKEKELLKLLQIFDTNINDIETIDNEVKIDLLNMPKRMNMQTLGGGFKRYIDIVTPLVEGGSAYVCIDEIENGLHFETMEKLLTSIIDLVKFSRLQLFITTHNLELLKIFSAIAKEKQYSNYSLFSIVRTKLKGLQAYKYDSINLEHVLETETEFRG